MATRLSVPPRKRPQPVRDTVLYLYGVTLPDKKNGAGVSISAVGIDGAAQVESDQVAGLVCWFSRVSKREFGDIVASSGADYLRQKAAQQVGKPHDGELAAEIKKFSAAIKKISTSSVEQAGKISSGRPDLEWQASFLISRPKQKELQKILKRFSDAWEGKRRIECTGPWPPYSFVSKS